MALDRRMMAFIDGENVVCRFQDMLKEGWTPHPTTKHHPDVYAWNPAAIESLTYYYETVNELSSRLSRRA